MKTFRIAMVLWFMWPNCGAAQVEPFIYHEFETGETMYGPVGPEKLPSESALRSIRPGSSESQVEHLIGPPTQKITNGDGTIVWTIWRSGRSKNIIETLVPVGQTYRLFFDSSSRFQRYESKMISQEEFRARVKSMQDTSKSKEKDQPDGSSSGQEPRSESP